MNKKNKPAKAKPSKPAQSSQQNLTKRMQLLGFVRGQDQFLALMSDMQQIDQELAQSRQNVRQCETGSRQEDECLARIRELEDQRFLLLGQLHGNRVNDYHLLNSEPKA